MHAKPAPTAVVADDERLMRDQIVGALKDAWPELVIAGEAGNGREAVAMTRMIPTSDILFFRAEDKYTRVQTETFEALIRKPIKELIEELDPKEFWQIHRATVVRVDAIAQVSRNLRGNQVVHLKGRDDKLEVSRTFS